MEVPTTTVQISLKALKQQLRKLGAVAYDLWLPETRALPSVLLPGEEINGIVYGRYTRSTKTGASRGALVATNQRVLLLNKKPLFVESDEISRFVVSAVTYTKVGPIGNVILHTKIGDISVRTFNQGCAQNFVKAIETLLNNVGGGNPSLAGV